jgi:hypothetical protein
LDNRARRSAKPSSSVQDEGCVTYHGRSIPFDHRRADDRFRRNGVAPGVTPGVGRAASFMALNEQLLEGCRRRLGDRLRGHKETIGERLVWDLAAFHSLPPVPYDACEKKGLARLAMKFQHPRKTTRGFWLPSYLPVTQWRGLLMAAVRDHSATRWQLGDLLGARRKILRWSDRRDQAGPWHDREHQVSVQPDRNFTPA